MYLLFWNPIFACSLIQNGKCICCKCDKDKHQRSKKHYIKNSEEKPLSSEKQKQIEEDEILARKLAEEYNKFDMNNSFRHF